jgi:hypothetical protein
MLNVKCQMSNETRCLCVTPLRLFGIWHLALSIVLLSFLAGCGKPIFRMPGGSQTRRDVYLNLMTPLQQAHFRDLEAKNVDYSLRMAYVQEIGVYQQWVEQPEEVQAAILHRQVVEEMTPLQVRLAWGSPDNERDETEPADRLAGHVTILWDYKPHLLRDGSLRYEQTVCFLDGRVLWVRRNP